MRNSPLSVSSLDFLFFMRKALHAGVRDVPTRAAVRRRMAQHKLVTGKRLVALARSLLESRGVQCMGPRSRRIVGVPIVEQPVKGGDVLDGRHGVDELYGLR